MHVLYVVLCFSSCFETKIDTNLSLYIFFCVVGFFPGVLGENEDDYADTITRVSAWQLMLQLAAHDANISASEMYWQMENIVCCQQMALFRNILNAHNTLVRELNAGTISVDSGELMGHGFVVIDKGRPKKVDIVSFDGARYSLEFPTLNKLMYPNELRIYILDSGTLDLPAPGMRSRRSFWARHEKDRGKNNSSVPKRIQGAWSSASKWPDSDPDASGGDSDQDPDQDADQDNGGLPTIQTRSAPPVSLTFVPGTAVELLAACAAGCTLGSVIREMGVFNLSIGSDTLAPQATTALDGSAVANTDVQHLQEVGFFLAH